MTVEYDMEKYDMEKMPVNITHQFSRVPPGEGRKITSFKDYYLAKTVQNYEEFRKHEADQLINSLNMSIAACVRELIDGPAFNTVCRDAFDCGGQVEADLRVTAAFRVEKAK